MKEILEKITTYNLFNYLFPGVLFAVALDELTSYSIHQENIVVGAFVYYFAGLVVSRFGSLIVEPFLKKIGFLKFVPYKDFVAASKADPKIEILSEANNMYRTFTALFVLLGILKIYELISINLLIPNEWSLFFLIVLLLVMFIFSYKKQTRYISERVNKTKQIN